MLTIVRIQERWKQALRALRRAASPTARHPPALPAALLAASRPAPLPTPAPPAECRHLHLQEVRVSNISSILPSLFAPFFSGSDSLSRTNSSKQ